MSFTLNTIDLTAYGIIAGHAPNSNIAMAGCFDLPKRIGKTYHDWGDSDGIEPYVASGEIFFGGRDLELSGSIIGSETAVFGHLDDFYTAINAASGTQALSTPYGDFDVLVQSVIPTHYHGGTKVKIKMREPVVVLSGGTLPGTGVNNYTIDSIPFVSFGLYMALKDGVTDLPEFKEQIYTKYGAEGFHPTKRKGNILNVRGLIEGNNVADFISKIKNLYLLFSSTGERQVKLNNELFVTCFADQGFEVGNIHVGSKVYAKFNAPLRVSAFSYTGF